MKARFIIILYCLSVTAYTQSLDKKYLRNETYTYFGLIDGYEQLADQSEWVDFYSDSLETDAGVMVPVVRVGREAVALESRKTPVLLILNGIHAGESCGIDASLHWVENLIRSETDLSAVTIYIIPIYNVGGSLNRSCCTRANQNGPESKGFRGNANNLDLNRDFIKCDSRNALSFNKLFQAIEPDVLVDTHSTNGADYQYHMTLIPYNWEKWPIALEEIGRKWFEKVREQTNRKVPTQYYVNVWGKTPESGFSAFEVTSIYSGGYAGLFNTLNFTAEAHMFKTYQERVDATVKTLESTYNTTLEFADEIIKARKQAKSSTREKTDSSYVTEWQIDSGVVEKIDFLGFEAEFYTSKLTGQPTYRYNREKPINYKTEYRRRYQPKSEVLTSPVYYIHKGNEKLIERLKANGVRMNECIDSLNLDVHVYYVTQITYANQPYEGHFAHRDFQLRDSIIVETFYPGDIAIPIHQPARAYILETLEPQTPGSFFRWNFFDTYLQQKEWFSSYIFEEKAIAFLADNPGIKAEFEKKRAEDEAFSKNHFAQLYWIYRQTPYYEKEHMRIPVFKSIRTRQ